jgi:hypothetical protein
MSTSKSTSTFTKSTMPALHDHVATLIQLIGLPVAHLEFDPSIAPEPIRATYRHFTKPHPRYKVIRNKTLGAALIDLHALDDRAAYLAGMGGKSGGASHAKRARGRGYVCSEIDSNNHIDAIHAINVSQPQRQGRPMDAAYLNKRERYEPEAHYRYFGALDATGKLSAYANVARFGNFAAFSQMMGLRNNDGAMHLLVIDVVCRLLDEGEVRYVMYDTFFGAHPGLRQFKTLLGFQPFRAKYALR